MTRYTLTVVCALVAGCDGDTKLVVDGPVEIERFASCEQMREYIEEATIKQMQLEIDERLASELRWRTDRSSPSASPAGSSPAFVSKANTRGKGDEPDSIKTDGQRLFVLSGENLFTLRSWPPQALQSAGRVQLGPSYRREMLLVGDRVVVLSAIAGAGVCGYFCLPNGTTKVTVVDVSDLDAPRTLHELELPGNYLEARRIESALHVVSHSSLRWPPEGIVTYDHFEGGPAEIKAGFARLKSENERRLRGRSLEQWLPESFQPASDQCSNYLQPSELINPAVLAVHSIDLDDPSAAPRRLTLLAEAGPIHVSSGSLYLSSVNYRLHNTDLYQVGISGADHPRLAAWGTVAGRLSSAAAMDERDGYLRVATTSVPDAASDATTTRISVLRGQDRRLIAVGQAETATSGYVVGAHVEGDRGYLSTSTEGGSLLSLDLSDPSHPRVTGELTSGGNQSSIHPLDGQRLLAVGHAHHRMRVTIFDVSNPGEPKERFGEDIGTSAHLSSYSAAHLSSYSAKALSYAAERGLLALSLTFEQHAPWPSTTADQTPQGSPSASPLRPTERYSELRLFSVDRARGITARGKLTFEDLAAAVELPPDWITPAISRSVIASSEEGIDYVYAVSAAAIRVAEVGALSDPIKTVLFDQP